MPASRRRACRPSRSRRSGVRATSRAAGATCAARPKATGLVSGAATSAWARRGTPPADARSARGWPRRRIARGGAGLRARPVVAVDQAGRHGPDGRSRRPGSTDGHWPVRPMASDALSRARAAGPAPASADSGRRPPPAWGPAPPSRAGETRSGSRGGPRGGGCPSRSKAAALAPDVPTSTATRRRRMTALPDPPRQPRTS